MSRVRKSLAIGSLSLALMVGSTAPSHALGPVILLVPAIATEVTAVTGVTASAISAAGSLLVYGLGAFFAWEASQSIIRLVAPYGSQSANEDQIADLNTSVGTGPIIPLGVYYPENTLSINGSYGGHLASVSTKSKAYGLVGGGSQTSFEFTFTTTGTVDFGRYNMTTGALDVGGGICGIYYKNVASGITYSAYEVATNVLNSSNTPSASTGNNSIVCAPAIQALITANGVNGTSVLFVGVFAGARPSTTVPCNAVGCAESIGLFGKALNTIPTTLTGTTICKNSAGASLTVAGTTSNMSTSGKTDVTFNPCPAGYYVFTKKIDQNAGGSISTIYKISQKSTAKNYYSECMGVTECELGVYVNGGLCDSANPLCVNWYVESINDPTLYQCMWKNALAGVVYTLPLENCSPLIYQYDPLATLDPLTGLAIASETLASPTTEASGRPYSEPSNMGYLGCAPTGWSLLNPLAYVGASGCLIKWAFIPEDFTGYFPYLQEVWATSNAGVFTSAMTEIPLKMLPLAGNASVNCQGPGFNLDLGPITTPRMIYPLNACAEPVQSAAAMAKLISTIAISYGGIVAVWNLFAGAVGLTKINWTPPSWKQDELF